MLHLSSELAAFAASSVKLSPFGIRVSNITWARTPSPTCEHVCPGNFPCESDRILTLAWQSQHQNWLFHSQKPQPSPSRSNGTFWLSKVVLSHKIGILCLPPFFTNLLRHQDRATTLACIVFHTLKKMLGGKAKIKPWHT